MSHDYTATVRNQDGHLVVECIPPNEIIQKALTSRMYQILQLAIGANGSHIYYRKTGFETSWSCTIGSQICHVIMDIPSHYEFDANCETWSG